MRILLVILIGCLFFLSFGIPAMAQTRIVNLTSIDAADISLETFDPGSHPLFSYWFQQPGWSRLRPYSLLLSNRSKQAITGITVIWSQTRPDGTISTFEFSSDAYLTGRSVVVPPGMRAVITPFITFPENLAQAGRFTGPELSGIDTRVDPYDRSVVGVRLDTVIFEDGYVIGPDDSDTVLSIQSRKTAAYEVMTRVRDGIAHGENVETLLNSLLSAPLTSKDRQGLWTTRFVKQLKNAPDLNAALNRLATLPSLPGFHRNR